MCNEWLLSLAYDGASVITIDSSHQRKNSFSLDTIGRG